ncbi:MAG: hypothetical protein VKJ46_06810 [Leptolyngbyaceae bacterium]|nr:hypothetical protein [Leptolyngbyaceae bacterium]
MKSRKTHNYTQSIPGKDYVFEWIDPISGRITGQGRGVRQRDYLVLKHDNTPICYQVEAIDYYADPADMWCALLKQVEEEP